MRLIKFSAKNPNEIVFKAITLSDFGASDFTKDKFKHPYQVRSGVEQIQSTRLGKADENQKVFKYYFYTIFSMMDKRGKTILKVSIVFLVLISLSLYFVLALGENTKTYDSETKTITIKNGVTEIAEIKLNTPLVYNVIRGKDRLVAEFTINNFEDYSNVFNDMEFYDVSPRDDSGEPKNNMKKFDRQFNYKYKTFYDIEVIDYETVCEDVITENGTEKSCHKNQISSHIEQRIKWNDFNEKAELPKGEITLGIFTDVLPNERVEWIPTMFGVEINEWAEWTESLNVNIVAGWDMANDPANSTNIIDVVTGSANGTLTGVDFVEGFSEGG